MATIVAFYLLFLALVAAGVMARQYWRGTHDLISLRNVVLIGFILFQLTGAAHDLLYPERVRQHFLLANVELTSVTYAAMATVFLVVFLWAYERGFLVRRAATKVPVTRAVPGAVMLWTLALAMLALALFLRTGEFVFGVHQVAVHLGVAFASLAAGIAGWLWAPRLFNPVVMIAAVAIVVAAVLISMYGAFGRRGIVAVGGALMWGMYFSHFRYMSPRRVLPRLALVGIIPILVLASFSSVREAGTRRTALEHARVMMTEGDMLLGLAILASGQQAGAISLWLIEGKRAGDIETRPLFSIVNTIIYPIPRRVWEDKPVALSLEVPRIAALRDMGREFNVGPGVIGHAAVEGGWIALLVYAVIGGLFLRFFDEIVRLHVTNPMVLLPFAAGLGQALAIPRGEVSSFTALFLIAVGGAYLATLLLGKVIDQFYAPAAMIDDASLEWYDEWDPHEDEPYAEYDAEAATMERQHHPYHT